MVLQVCKQDQQCLNYYASDGQYKVEKGYGKIRLFD